MKLAFSTCPNDTFIFEALIHKRLQDNPFEFEVQLADIQELNALAFSGVPDVVKVSFPAYSRLRNEYQLLDSGSALGHGVGPLLLSAKPMSREELSHTTIAIPGWDTTAHLLLQHYLPEASQKTVLRFDKIMPALAKGEIAAGVVIHEGRFTYPEYGLRLIQDLGAYWEETVRQPIPLGGIIARKTLGSAVIRQLEQKIAESISFAWQNPATVMPYVRTHAQEMSEAVMQQHIHLYVNAHTESLGKAGRAAVETLLAIAERLTLQGA